MASFDRAERRATNIAEWAAVSSAFRRLPKHHRDLLLADFRHQKAIGGAMTWMDYVVVAMPLLPSPEALLERAPASLPHNEQSNAAPSSSPLTDGTRASPFRRGKI